MAIDSVVVGEDLMFFTEPVEMGQTGSLTWTVQLFLTAPHAVPESFIPEPSTGLLFGLGLVGLAVRRRHSN